MAILSYRLRLAAPSVDQSVALDTTHQVVPVAVVTDQAILKADKPSIKVDPPSTPIDPAKVAGDSGNPTAQPCQWSCRSLRIHQPLLRCRRQR